MPDTRTPCVVYYPAWGERMAPSIVFWTEDGKLREYAPNPDAYSVARARMEMNWKNPNVSWAEYFVYLADKNPSPAWWDLYLDVDYSSTDIRGDFDKMRAQWETS